MRLEAGRCDYGWEVFDLGSCEFLDGVTMVDTDQAVYERVVMPLRIEWVDGEPHLPKRLHLARKIEVFPSCKLVIVFPWAHPQMARWAA